MTTWGRWTLNARTVCLETLISGTTYEIPLDEMTDAAKVLDWVFQIEEKTWASNSDVGDLVTAIRSIFGRGFVGGGINNPLDPKPALRKLGCSI